MSQVLQQQTPMQKIKRKQQKLKKKSQLSNISFIVLSCLLCLTSMVTISRLHLFDQVTSAAQLRYINQQESITQIELSITEEKSVFAIITDFCYETPYLLLIITGVSIIFLLSFRLTMQKIYTCLLVTIIGILVCFLLLLLAPQNFVIYRFTYILHAMLLVPLLLISSFCLYRLIPIDLIKYKNTYCAVMFLLPFLGSSLEPYITNTELYYNLILTQQSFRRYILKNATIGSTISALLIFIFNEVKPQINQTIKNRMVPLPSPSVHQIQFHNPEGKELKSYEEEENEANKQQNDQNIFGVKQEQFKNNINCVTFIMMIIGWSIIIAIGWQLPRLQFQILNKMEKSLQSNTKDQSSKQSVKSEQSKITQNIQPFISNLTLFQELTLRITIIGFSLVFLQIGRRFGSIKLLTGIYLVGFTSIFIILLAIKGFFQISVSEIRGIFLASRCFFQSLIIPAVFSQNLSLSISQKASIILLFSIFIQFIVKITTQTTNIDTQVLILGFFAITSLLIFDLLKDQQINFQVQQPLGYKNLKVDDKQDERDRNKTNKAEVLRQYSVSVQQKQRKNSEQNLNIDEHQKPAKEQKLIDLQSGSKNSENILQLAESPSEIANQLASIEIVPPELALIQPAKNDQNELIFVSPAQKIEEPEVKPSEDIKNQQVVHKQQEQNKAALL